MFHLSTSAFTNPLALFWFYVKGGGCQLVFLSVLIFFSNTHLISDMPCLTQDM